MVSAMERRCGEFSPTTCARMRAGLILDRKSVNSLYRWISDGTNGEVPQVLLPAHLVKTAGHPAVIHNQTHKLGFEFEYPETRTSTNPIPSPGAQPMASSVEFTASPDMLTLAPPSVPPASPVKAGLKPISGGNTEVSTHSRYLEKEEGQMHWLAYYVKGHAPSARA